ncbi:methyltransferase domain-containing protein [Polyangium spumosum]|uniref:Methyltransferase domain-containing protein n=2 Tax=Polyangium spumosum TaxID=889282 RepID=A0A6N7Q378_9BACT|nr:methyltransferase domain-containing protein [Polyangium spumosum]
MTERLLRDAGVGAGMRVLDAGCGRGDVTFLVARLVGDGGRVLGIDRDTGALSIARERARELGLSNVEFMEADLAAPDPDRHGFDAVVGRRVLMYQADRVAAVRALSAALRPGGVMVFHEVDATMVPASRTPLPLHAQVHRWMWETVAREGATTSMGFELPFVLEEAGLVVEDVRAEAVVQTAKARHGGAPILRAMMPRIVGHGVATEAEIDVDTLDERLADELRRSNAVYIGDMVFGAWARKPG